MAKSLNDDGQPTAVVRVDNPGAVPADRLQFAEGRAGEIFRRIDIRVTWVDAQTAIREEEKIVARYTVVLTDQRFENLGQGLVDDALGRAAPFARRAYVYYDRIAATQIGEPRTVGSILGDVIAHELGHLMLPSLDHSFTGIMRPNVSADSSWIETFNAAQARQIRTRLRQAP
jgi:hypothetical protein